jgi:hypothetical protein
VFAFVGVLCSLDWAIGAHFASSLPADGLLIALGAPVRRVRASVNKAATAGLMTMALPLTAPRFVDCAIPFILHAVIGTIVLIMRDNPTLVTTGVAAFAFTCIIACLSGYWADYRRRTNVLLDWRLSCLGVCVVARAELRCLLGFLTLCVPNIDLTSALKLHCRNCWPG